MVLQTSFKRANTHSNDEAHNPTPFKHVKPPAKVPTSPSSDIEIVDPIKDFQEPEVPSPGVSDEENEEEDNHSDLDLHDTSMLNEEEKLWALAIVDKKIKEIASKGKGSTVKAKKDQERDEKAAKKATDKAEKEAAKAKAKEEKAVQKAAEKVEKEAAKAKEREEKEATKAKEREEKEAAKMKNKGKGKGKAAGTEKAVAGSVGTVGDPPVEAIVKSKWMKKDKVTSGTWEVVAAIYSEQLAVAGTAAAGAKSKDEENTILTGGRGGKDVGKGKGCVEGSINKPPIVGISKDVAMHIDQPDADPKTPKKPDGRNGAKPDKVHKRKDLPSR